MTQIVEICLLKRELLSDRTVFDWRPQTDWLTQVTVVAGLPQIRLLSAHTF